jgi:7-cyano-7-deazaguanine tRNA-ribosyltransferase
MRIVAGLSLKGIKPRVWDTESPYHLPNLRAVMVSYADFMGMPAKRRKAMEQGLHSYLGIPDDVSIYLDNGSYYFFRKGGKVDWDKYAAFVKAADPDWYPIPQDYIPTPKMSDEEQLDCLRRTMAVNCAHQQNGYVPVIHIGRYLEKYLDQLQTEELLAAKSKIALGGIVPNLLRAPNAMSYADVLDNLYKVCSELKEMQLHVFGIGGTATLHLAALMSVDSVDSSGWRNRAARGIVQLTGRGERIVAELGNWRGRRPDKEEWQILANCHCPACEKYGLEGLKANRLYGFCNRATHNLWVLLEEALLIEQHLIAGDYADWYIEHVENSVYLPLIQKAMKLTRYPILNKTSI